MKAIEHNKTRKGFVLIYYTLSLFLILPVVGLAIDLGMLYNVKAKLQTAIDAASFAAGRCMNSGYDYDDARPVAISVGQQWFRANFPDGYWGSTLTSGSPDVDVYRDTTNLSVNVKVTAAVKTRLWFMQTLDFPESTVGTESQVTRRNVNLVLVLDDSASIKQSDADEIVQDKSYDFVNTMIEGQDNVGLVTFGTTVHPQFTPIKEDFKELARDAIYNSMTFQGYTNSASGLAQAYQMITDLKQPKALNVIVFFTDGRPTALTCDFPLKTKSDTRYGTGVDRDNFNADREYTVPATTCTYNAKPYITATASVAPNRWPPDSTGATNLLQKPKWTASGSNDNNALADNVDNCTVAYRRNHSNRRQITLNNRTITLADDPSSGRMDVAYIPNVDVYGNATNLGYSAGMAPVLFTAAYTYKNQIRPDLVKNIRFTAYNAAYNCAMRIRGDTTYNTVVFTIGLGGSSGESIDDDFLRRVANDPDAADHNPDRPKGLYAKASDKTQLKVAYDRVASQILRLCQ